MIEEEEEDDFISVTCDECGEEAFYNTNIGSFCMIHKPF